MLEASTRCEGTNMPHTSSSVRRAQWQIGVVAAIVGLLLASAAWATNGQEPVGWGAKAIARGGADVGVGSGPISMNQNPASLAQLVRRELELGPQVLIPNVHFQNARNKKVSRFNDVVLPNAAYGMPLGDRVAIGLGAFVQSGLGVDFKLAHAMWPGEEISTETEFAVMKLSAGVAVKATDKLKLGAALNVGQANWDFRTVVGPVWLSVENANGLGVGGTVGAMLEATDKLTLGASYCSPIWFRGDLETDKGEVRFSPLIGGGHNEYERVYMKNFQFPQKASVGASYKVTDKWRVMTEVRWVDNSDSTFDHCQVKFRRGVHGAGDLDARLELEQREQFIYIIGTEYDLHPNWTVAVGYNHGEKPNRERFLFAACPSIVERHFTCGIRYHQEAFYVGLSYVRAFTAKIRSTGSNGRNDIDGGIDYGNAKIRHNQHSVILGLGYRF